MFVQLQVVLILVVGAVVCLTTLASAQTMQSLAHSPTTPLPPPGVAPPASLEQLPPSAPTVTYENGVLTISAENSSLSDILRGIRSQTGADVDIPPHAGDRVSTRLGPGPARDVVYSLLVASRFNYVIVGSVAHPNALAQVLLIAKHAADNVPQPLVSTADVVQQPRFQPTENTSVEQSEQQQEVIQLKQRRQSIIEGLMNGHG